MSNLPVSVDYTARDFDALLSRLKRDTKSVFPGWTDWSQANFGVILAEMMCYVGDVIGFYQDGQAREAFLSTCTQRVNAIRHGRQVGYRLSRATAAQVDLQFTLQQTYAGDVTFPQWFVVRSPSVASATRVQLLSDLDILSGNTVGTVTAENSLTHTETQEASSEADQQFALEQTPFLDTVSVSDASGEFGEVDSFLNSSSTDRHYIVLVDEDGRAQITFGDGTNGAVPTGVKTVVYKTGGGAITMDADTLTQPEGSITDALGTPVSFTVTNPSGSTGGTDKETIEQARLNIPAARAALTRSVHGDDFVINAKRVSGIVRGLMLTSDQYASLDENYGILYLVAQGAATANGYAPASPTAAQLASAKGIIDGTYKPCVTFRYDVLAATFKDVDITARVWLREGAVASTVDTAIRANLADYFAATNTDGTPTETVDFGFNYKDHDGVTSPLVPWGDLFTIVKQTAGVNRVDEDAMIPTDDVTLQVYEFPRLGSITLVNAETGLALA